MKKYILLTILTLMFFSYTPSKINATAYYSENPGSSWLSLNSNSNNIKYLLHNSSNNNALEFAVFNNGVTNWRALSITKDGKIGIGTTNPAWRFQMDTDGSQSSFLINGNGSGTTNRIFQVSNGVNKVLTFLANGNVGIGTIYPSHTLSVNGTVRAKEILVQSNNWADYVFEDGYNLMNLSDVEKYINENKHLPNIPNFNEVSSEGLSLGEMQRLHMEKIEELTLYTINQEKRINELENTVKDLIEVLKTK